MNQVIVGGHTRNIGKTALVVDLIRALPELEWTAVKLTLYGHRFCSDHSGRCDCAPRGRVVAIDEETHCSSGTDSSRFLAAGALRAFWLRAHRDRLAEALPVLREALVNAQHVIIESNSLVGFERPDLYLVVLDPGRKDFKPSALRFLDLADAAVLRAPYSEPPWEGVPEGLLRRLPTFTQPLGAPLPVELAALVRKRIQRPGAVSTRHG
jgi:molybdopterin-guanine dinucleotide biosynthesis protein